MKKTDLAYWAGIFDGEGSISICRGPSKSCHTGFRYKLQIAVTSADEWLVQALRMAFGGSINISASPWSGRPIWRWTLTAHRAMECLELIAPYLHLKREQATIAIQFQKTKMIRNHRRAGKGAIRVTDAEYAVEEAQRILLGNMHRKGKRYAPKLESNS